jgi:hypothetical protein
VISVLYAVMLCDRSLHFVEHVCERELWATSDFSPLIANNIDQNLLSVEIIHVCGNIALVSSHLK